MYSVTFAPDVAEELAEIESPLERRKVLAAIQCLPIDPENQGIGEVIDAAGQIHRIGMAGGTAFIYRADHALRQIQILAVRPVVE